MTERRIWHVQVVVPKTYNLGTKYESVRDANETFIVIAPDIEGAVARARELGATKVWAVRHVGLLTEPKEARP